MQARTRFAPERAVFFATALALAAGMQMPVGIYLSPKNGIGYTLGIVGGVMLLLQALYALRKRLPSLRFLGSVPAWFQWHVVLGTVAPLLILIHCGFTLGATNSNVALVAMLLVAGSGIFGRYFYSKIHRGLHGRKATLSELQQRAEDLKERGTKLKMMPELVQRVEQEEHRLLSSARHTGLGILLAPITIAASHAFSGARLRRHARRTIKAAAARHRAIASQRARIEHITFDYIARRLRATREVAEFRTYERLFSVWHVLHVPLFLILIAAGIVHVVSVHVY